jgi:hypothetical protein
VVHASIFNGNIAVASNSNSGKVSQYEINESLYDFDVQTQTELKNRKVRWQQHPEPAIGLAAETIYNMKLDPADLKITGFGADPNGDYNLTGSLFGNRQIAISKNYPQPVDGNTQRNYNGSLTITNAVGQPHALVCMSDVSVSGAATFKFCLVSTYWNIKNVSTSNYWIQGELPDLSANFNGIYGFGSRDSQPGNLELFIGTYDNRIIRFLTYTKISIDSGSGK